jgi:mannose-6-phosphate isomerase-like protein (cupin superfamily)
MTNATMGDRVTGSDTAKTVGTLSRTAAGEGPAYWFFDALAIIRTPETVLPVVIEVTVPPGGGAPLHVHADLDDSFYLASGTLAVRCGETSFAARSGGYVVLPHGVPHTFQVVGDENAVMVQIHNDDSFLRFIKAVGRPATERKLPPSEAPHDLDALYTIAAETGQPVIGPPMSSEEAAAIISGAAV